MPPSDSQPRWQALHTHKRGNVASEYEDAFAGDVAKSRFAVADGASESSFAGEWARRLVEGFIAARGRPWRQLDWLEPARQDWASEVDGRPLPWYAEEKREQGAYSTLLGISFGRTRSKPVALVWHALAVGDSCLFRLHDGKLRLAFPLTRADQFGNLPGLLGSRGHPADTPEKAIKRQSGRWRPGDRFLLATDALAEWMLRRQEQENNPTADIDALLAERQPQEAFAAWVEERRDKQGLRNDDVTLMVIDFPV